MNFGLQCRGCILVCVLNMRMTPAPISMACRTFQGVCHSWSSVLALSLLAVLTMALLPGVRAEDAPAPLQWHEATEFQIEGRGWAETSALYSRLPARAKGVVPDSVWGLSQNSAGMCVRFQTDAAKLQVRWVLTGESLAMPHMPATGVSGVDLYRREASGAWRFVANGRPTQYPTNETSFATETEGRPTEMLLYLPLYNGVRQVQLAVPSGGTLSQAPQRAPHKQRPIVFYGTSITQGGCASRPGMAYTAIVGRMLDQPVVNLGFSGSGKMEPAVSSLVGEIDGAVFVIDCLWNIGDISDEDMAGRVEALVTAVRRTHPDAPILFVGQSHIATSTHPRPTTANQQRAVEKLRQKGIRGLFLMGGEKLLGNDVEGTVDGVHPNDLGMMRHAEVMAPAIKRILQRDSHR